MISVVIPTLDAEARLGRTLAALVPAAVDGLVRQAIIADGGSRDRTLEIAEGAGAEIVTAEAGRGAQLAAGAARARFPWLLLLSADTELEAGWEREAAQFMERVDTGKRAPAAAAFRFMLDDTGLTPRAMEALVRVRATLLKRPSLDQGLLIPRRLYDEIGGSRTTARDLDLARRLGRRRIVLLRAPAVASAARYRRDGYLRRALYGSPLPQPSALAEGRP